MTASPVVALLGATGAVGGELLDRLLSRPQPFQLDAFAGPEHADGEDADIHPLTADETLDADIVVLATPPAVTAGLAARVDDGVILDLSGLLRDAPLILGPQDAGERRTARLADAATASVIPVLRALTALDLRAAHLVVFDSASSRGRAALDGLRDQAIALLSFRDPLPGSLGGRLAFDLIQNPQSAGRTRAELVELQPSLTECSVQRILTSSFIGLGIALTLSFEATVTPADIDARLADHPELTAHPRPDLAGAVAADRILVSPAVAGATAHQATLWLTADNLRLTAERAAGVLRAWCPTP